MVKKISKKLGAWLLLCVLSFMMIYQNSITSEAVTPSKEDYSVVLKGPRYFIHNKKTLGSEIGTEYYMTYTVKRTTELPKQFGLIGTGDYTRNFPYSQGGLMRHIRDEEGTLLDEGYTYFIKFVVAKGGFTYNVTRGKGDQLEDMYMDNIFGEAADDIKYFGIWAAEGMVDAELTDVRFYDAKGNDLGVAYETPTKTGLVMEGSTKLTKDTQIDHWYDVEIVSQKNIGISNVRIPTTAQVYIEYNVKSAEYLLSQEGIALHNEPKSDYVYRNGYLKYKHNEGNKLSDYMNLLDVGAEYIIYCDRQDDRFNAYVQKTKNGIVTTELLETTYGTHSKDFDFVSLWFGAGSDSLASFKLSNFKIYDGNRNNLGVQVNVPASVLHYGELEDYAGCEALYYCEENGGLIALYKDQSMTRTFGQVTDKATYKVSENVMTAKYAEGTEEYEYLYRKITDDEENVYERLYHYKLSFVTGTDEVIDTQEFSNEKGYYAMRPTDPVMEGYDFQGWFTSDGQEYDFAQLVTGSDILYAKWSGDGGVSFLAGEDVKTVADMTYVLMGVGVVLLVAGVIACIVFVRKGLKHENR